MNKGPFFRGLTVAVCPCWDLNSSAHQEVITITPTETHVKTRQSCVLLHSVQHGSKPMTCCVRIKSERGSCPLHSVMEAPVTVFRPPLRPFVPWCLIPRTHHRGIKGFVIISKQINLINTPGNDVP